MDQQKTGAFLQRLRKEKNLTQEQLAERFCTSRRTVSRWETGKNLPDIDILIEMADFYEVELRELLNGERKTHMNDPVKEAVLTAAEYDNERKAKDTTLLSVFLAAGLAGILVNQILFHLSLPATFWTGLARGLSAGAGIAAMVFGFCYVAAMRRDLRAEKKRLLEK